MKKLISLLLALGGLASAQVINNTTFAAGPSSVDSVVYVYGTSNQSFNGAILFVDLEAMQIIAVGATPGGGQGTGFPNVLALSVSRGVLGTAAASHSAGGHAFYGQPGQFVTSDPSGGCQNGQPQVLNPATQRWFSCVNSVWVAFTTVISGGGGGGSPGGISGDIQTNSAGSFGGVTLVPIIHGGTGTATPALVAGTNITLSGTWPNVTINSTAGGTPGGTSGQFQTNNAGAFGGVTVSGDGTLSSSGVLSVTNLTHVTTGILALANGGTGTATPSLVGGTNITISGTFPNQTISHSGVLPLSLGGTGTATPAMVGGTNISVSGTFPAQTINFSGILPVASGGTGTSTPALVAGTNVTITGSWPNQTINSSGSGGGSPLTTKGDLFTFSTVAARQPAGPDGSVLSYDSAQTTGLNHLTLNTLGNGVCTVATGVGTLQTNLAETIRSVTTTSDIILATDCLVTYANAAAIAVSLPAAGTGGNFYSGQKFTLSNYGPGTVTVTPSTGNIAGFPTLVIGANQSCQVYSDGTTNYQRACGLGGVGNCSSSASPAACGADSAGSFVIAAAGTSVVVNTTAVTANSQVLVQEDETLGTKLGVTCNTGILANPPAIKDRTAGTSFTVGVTAGLAINPVCFSYHIVN